ncbi:MAG: T9SS type A sorting domain-containing protein [Chitinophagaceae bacterium]|nr:T9SS type A sorting domain-containing protein [Chitinophagaceae bacterium]
MTRVKKFDAAGTALWSYFDNAGIGAPLNFKFTPDQKILIISRGLTGNINGFAKIDLDGNQVWSIAGTNSYSAGDAAGDAGGNTYLVNGEYVISNAAVSLKKYLRPGLFNAYLAASTLFQMAVCKVYSNGASAWVATTTGSAAYALAFGTDTSIFVTGGTTARLTQELIALPVKLTRFAARKYENQVLITWESAEELNLSHYILQYSEDGTRFTDISNITAKGSNSSYTYTDMNRPAPHIYYRLRSVDIDGRARVSAVVHLSNDLNAPVTKLTVFPNPVQQEININFVSPKNMEVDLRLYSLDGKQVQTYRRTASPGTNFYQLELSSGLPAGTYILTANDGEGNRIQTKIIKQ